MKRSTLKRKTPLRPKRSKPRRTEQVRDPEWLDDVRKLPCRAVELERATPCMGRVEAHHAGVRPGVGVKCGDDDTVPLCRGHHDELHSLSNTFKRFDKAKLQAWREDQIAWTRAWVNAKRRLARLLAKVPL